MLVCCIIQLCQCLHWFSIFRRIGKIVAWTLVRTLTSIHRGIFCMSWSPPRPENSFDSTSCWLDRCFSLSVVVFTWKKLGGRWFTLFLTCAACFHTGWLMPLKFNATLQTQRTSGERSYPKKWWNGGFGRQSLGNWRVKYDEHPLFLLCKKPGPLFQVDPRDWWGCV